MLREAMRETLAEHTMTIHEMVLLPDHLHLRHPRRGAGLLAADPAKQHVHKRVMHPTNWRSTDNVCCVTPTCV
jgi:hypothetical protein